MTLENDFDKVVTELWSLFGVHDEKKKTNKVLKLNYSLNTQF